ncbi:hypothetical protein [Stenotrophomonas pavanii]|uniref:hypothetical protein n=1 Tax=Stenotrophomonas pavanii TaxID=487698 RepID=UPI0039C65A1D
MARQIIDTTTPHGGYVGDPAKTAFGKTNDNFSEVYQLAGNALPRSGGEVIGTLRVTGPSLVYPINPNPTNGVASLGFVANGSYGGGGGMIDGQASIGWWSSFGEYNLGFASSPTGALTSRMRCNASGTVTAVAFNPTSSADVKDFIIGYDRDADAEIDRLVVVEYSMRPGFLESDKRYIGLLAENVHSVLPDATDGGIERERAIEVPIPYEPGNEPEPDEDGHVPAPPTRTVLVREVIPMNYDMAQILALNTRAHQTKNRRIRDLEEKFAALQQIVANLQAGEL